MSGRPPPQAARSQDDTYGVTPTTDPTTDPTSELTTDLRLPQLRAERRRLTQEAERLVWLRRLVIARRDLEVARLAGVGAGLWGTDDLPPLVQAALQHHLGLGPDLLHQLASSARTLKLAADSTQHDLRCATDELVRRYQSQPLLCLPPHP